MDCIINFSIGHCYEIVLLFIAYYCTSSEENMDIIVLLIGEWKFTCQVASLALHFQPCKFSSPSVLSWNHLKFKTSEFNSTWCLWNSEDREII